MDIHKREGGSMWHLTKKINIILHVTFVCEYIWPHQYTWYMLNEVYRLATRILGKSRKGWEEKGQKREREGKRSTSSCPRLSFRRPVSSLKVTSFCDPNDTALNLHKQTNKQINKIFHQDSQERFILERGTQLPQNQKIWEFNLHQNSHLIDVIINSCTLANNEDPHVCGIRIDKLYRPHLMTYTLANNKKLCDNSPCKGTLFAGPHLITICLFC